jgi:hypothetical protein
MAKKRPTTSFDTAHHAAHSWPRRCSAPSLFTAFVRSLQGEHTPDADLFHDAWHGLRAALASEMKRRGLWQSPPSYLGTYGHDRWDTEDAPRGDPRAPAGGAAGTQVSALAELVADCYAYIFVDRLPSLKRHLAQKADIDGLVLLNVRHFLHERQRAHDPLGFRVFELVQAATAQAVARGALHVLAGDERVRNDTVLGFDPAARPPATPSDLAPIVVRWNDELLPGLVAQGRRQGRVVGRLQQRLLELPRHGVNAFRFKDLLDPLKSDVRQRWAALLAREDQQASAVPPRGAGQPPLPAPEALAASRENLAELARCVSASIHSLVPDRRTRNYLATLWQYLRTRHGSGEDVGGAWGDRDLQWQDHPSYRQLGRRLSIPRERMPLLFATLRQLVARCGAAGQEMAKPRLLKKRRTGDLPRR